MIHCSESLTLVAFQPGLEATMLRREVVSDQAAAGDALDGAGKPRGAAFFAVPRLLVGLAAAKCALPECDSLARSPTSPLDLRAFAALRGSLLRSPRSPRSWDSRRVGLGGLVDTLAEPAADAKNRLLGPQLRPTNPQCLTKSYTSLPRDCGHAQPVLGKVESAAATGGGGGMSVPCSRFYGDVKSGPEVILSGGAHLVANSHSVDLGKLPAPGSLPVSIGGPCRYIGSVSATEVEQSEDYTCIIAHSPNPKTTHIFGDCILEPCTVRVSDGESRETKQVKEGAESYWLVKCSSDAGEEFMRFCSTCKKKLDGNDSCIYRGEKAFCSGNRRDQEIIIEEEENNTEASSPSSAGSSSSFQDDILMAGTVVLT